MVSTKTLFILLFVPYVVHRLLYVLAPYIGTVLLLVGKCSPLLSTQTRLLWIFICNITGVHAKDGSVVHVEMKDGDAVFFI